MSSSTKQHMLYPMWDEVPMAVLTRAPLATVEPIGVGTAMVESLSSYTHRLADTHGIPQILLIKYLLRTSARGPLSRLAYPLSAVDGVDEWTAAFVRTYALQTNCSSLITMTMCAWANVISHARLIRRSHAWCPVCVESSLQQGLPTYAPLLWSLADVTACPIHQCQLETLCPHCKMPQMATSTSRFRSGSCAHCQQELQMPLAKTRVAEDWELFTAQAIGRLLSIAPLVDTPISPCYFLAKLSSLCGRDGIGITRLAKAIGVHHPIIAVWRRQAAKPLLTVLLRISWCLDLSLSDLLTTEVSPHIMSLRALPALASRPYTAQKKGHRNVSRQLRALLQPQDANEPTLSMSQISIRLGHSQAYFYRRHRTAYSKAMRKYSASRKTPTRTSGV